MTKWVIEKLVYPYMEKKKGNKVRQKTRELVKNQELDYTALAKLQEEKLKALLLHCVNHVPAYESLAYLEEEIKDNPKQALWKFPILEKSDFKANLEEYFSKKVDKSLLIPNETGGSSGEPVKFFMDRPTVEYYEAARWRGLSWWDISQASPSVMIWGNPKETDMLSNRRYKLKERWLKNRIILPAFDLEAKRIKEYIGKINRFKPEYFYGYSTALETFSKLMEEAGLELEFYPKAVVSTAETLHTHQREIIERVFKCPVVNEYGARDGGIMAYQCKEGSMHISWDNLIMEVVDPVTMKVLGPGEEGALLITDLNNFSMPRLRYNVGDIGKISDKKCSCGKTLPVLEELLGREAEMFITSEGKLIHAFAFNPIARATKSIKRYKIIQESPLSIKLLIVKSKAFTNAEIQVFVKNVAEAFPGAKVEVSYVDEIPRKKSGKEDLASREFDLK